MRTAAALASSNGTRMDSPFFIRSNGQSIVDSRFTEAFAPVGGISIPFSIRNVLLCGITPSFRWAGYLAGIHFDNRKFKIGTESVHFARHSANDEQRRLFKNGCGLRL